MASLLESLTQSFTPDIVGTLGKAGGLDGPNTSKGVGVVGPLLTSALAGSASTPSGLDSLMGMVSQVGASSTPGDLMKMVTGGAGTPMTSSLFGSGLGAVGGTLDRALGFKVSSLIPLAAPFVISQISKRMSGGALDKAGAARLLQDEQKAFMSQGGPVGPLVQQALDAGKQATTTIAKYSPDQWSKVRLGPIAAAALVIGASPSGVMGTTKEVMALGDAITELKTDTAPTSIFNLAAEKQVTAEELTSLPTDPGALASLVRESVNAVAANNPGEAAEYKQFLVSLATKVAEASKEGGFLGLGGTRISEAEQRAIDQIKAAVGMALV